MTGIKMNEFYEFISHFHEAEFEYKGRTYVLQTEINDGKPYLVIWDCTPKQEKCISRQKIGSNEDIPISVIDKILSEKCFNGKSFLDIEQYITVTTIY